MASSIKAAFAVAFAAANLVFVNGVLAQTVPNNTTDNTRNSSPSLDGSTNRDNASQVGQDDNRGSGVGASPNCTGAARSVGSSGQVANNGSQNGPDSRSITSNEQPMSGSTNCLTVSPTTTSDANAQGGAGGSATSGPSNAQIDSAIKNAVNLNPQMTTTDINALRQQLQSDPTLTAKLNSTNKADQQSALTSLNKLSNGSASSSAATNQGVSTPVTVNQPNNSQYTSKVDARVMNQNEIRPVAISGSGEYAMFKDASGNTIVVDCRDMAGTRGLALNLGFGWGGQAVDLKVVRGNHALCAIPQETVTRGVNSIIDGFARPPLSADAEATQKAINELRQAQLQGQRIDIRINNGGGNTPVVVKHGS